MRELRDLVAAFRALGPSGAVAVLGTVVHAEGSTYRRPGARWLGLPDGSAVGLVSGGCLEGDLLERARAVVASGSATRVRYDSTGDDDLVWGLGLGCAGVVEVLLEPVSASAPGPLSLIEACLAARSPGALVTALEGGPGTGAHAALHPDGRFDVGGWAGAPSSLRRDVEAAARRAADERRTRRQRVAGVDLLVEPISPPPRLLLFGAGADAAPVVRLAAELGWSVEVVDGRAAFARAERLPEAERVILCEPDAVAERVAVDADTLVLVMTHHYLHDRAILRALLGSPARYVGVLGPRRRTEDLLADLRDEGVAPGEAALERLFAPAGLDVGADAPEQIALSVVAEMQAVLCGRSGGRLRERKGPIHDPVT